MSETEPKGMVIILVNATGSVVAHAADFEQQGYGGFTLLHSQKIRVRSRLAYNFLKSYASEDIASVIEDYDAKKIVDDLCVQKGYKLRFILIGHDEAAE